MIQYIKATTKSKNHFFIKHFVVLKYPLSLRSIKRTSIETLTFFINTTLYIRQLAYQERSFPLKFHFYLPT